METEVNFRQTRDVGEMLNATLYFVREHFRPLATALVFVAGPFLLLSVVGSLIMQRRFVTPAFDPTDPSAGLAMFTSPYYYLAIFASMIGTSMILLVTFSYVMHYVDTGEQASVDDVVSRVLSDIRAHITTILGMTLAFILSMVIILIPCLGVLAIMPLWAWMGVMFSLLWPARIHEELSFMDGFDRAKELVKDFFWPTLGFLVLVFIVQFVIMIVFAIPSMVAGFGMAFGSLQGDTTSVPLGLMIVGVFASMVGSLVYALGPVGATVNYFNLVERKEAPGLAERVDQLGDTGTSDFD